MDTVKIVGVACRYGQLILAMPKPNRHHNIFKEYATQFEKYLPMSRSVGGDYEEQGFITSEGEFVDRIEAMIIALKADQLLLKNPNYKDDRLFSEDLW